MSIANRPTVQALGQHARGRCRRQVGRRPCCLPPCWQASAHVESGSSSRHPAGYASEKPTPMKMQTKTLFRAAAFTLAAACAGAQPAPPVGEIKGTAWVHTPQSQAAVVQQADVCLPAAATGGAVFCGKFKDLPKTNGQRVPTVIFLHGSSGLGLKAIGEWQQWLASLGFASMAPDSYALPNRLTYKSPVDKATYEQVHALRQSEIALALASLQSLAWVDTARLVLAGTSEGAVPVARHNGAQFAARMLYAWGCEQNYFVAAPNNVFEADKPVLNVISASDPFFSQSNSWLGNPSAQGHCASALKDNPRAAVVLIPNAPHTLLNLPAARHATQGFLAALGWR